MRGLPDIICHEWPDAVECKILTMSATAARIVFEETPSAAKALCISKALLKYRVPYFSNLAKTFFNIVLQIGQLLSFLDTL